MLLLVLSLLVACLASAISLPRALVPQLSQVAQWAPYSARSHDLPHYYAAFEGTYTRVQLPDNSTIVIILAEVRGIEALIHVSLTPGFKYEIITKHMNTTDSGITLGELGEYQYTPDVQSFTLNMPGGMRLQVTLDNPVPWISAEGPLAELGPLIPLHWHILSLRSTAHVTITNGTEPAISQTGHAHIEKNWGASFPKGWIWSQGTSSSANLVLAGGLTMGVEAYLIGYRSGDISWDFRPPLTVRKGALGSGIEIKQAWEEGALEMVVSDGRRKLHVIVRAPKGTFISMAGPLKEGFRKDYAHESFQARMTIHAYTRLHPFAHWSLVDKQIIEPAALEFGGCYYKGARLDRFCGDGIY